MTSFDEKPFTVMKTTKISIVPFKNLTFDIVKREGEDETLEIWQKKSGYTYD